jgi:transposase
MPRDIARSGWPRSRNPEFPGGGTVVSAVGPAATVRHQARRDLLPEGRKHEAVTLLRQIPAIGPIWCRFGGGIAANTPPFPNQATDGAYSGFAIETHDSGEYRYVPGKLRRIRERITVRGLNDNHNHDQKNLFKALLCLRVLVLDRCTISMWRCLKRGRPTMARLTLARKIAAITLTIWKKGVSFDATQLHRQAA